MASKEPDAKFDYESADENAKSNIELQYLAEGAANIIYHFTPTENASLPVELQGQLLRLRKDKTTSLANSEVILSFQERIMPVFDRRYLISQKLWNLPPDLISDINSALVQRETQGTRPAKRRGLYVASQKEEPYGILVEDLSAKGENEQLLEFKPKWLLQSPSAPSEAKKCRTCALRDMRDAQNVAAGRGDSGFCPLDLLSGKSSVLRPALSTMWKVEFQLDRFETAFRQKVQRLLGMLKGLQAKHAGVGLSDLADGEEENLAVAMAIRDCSVFLKVVYSKESIDIVDVKLADLDLKSTKGGKREKWVETERNLIKGGWYESKGTDTARGGSEILCWLARTCS